MGNRTIKLHYELDDSEVYEIVTTELQEYIKLLQEFLSDPEHYDDANERLETIEDVVHLKAVLKRYMDTGEYEAFIKEIENENNKV